MFESTLLILLVALVLDWFFGEPELVWSRIPHPVVLFGKAVSWCDARFNNAEEVNPLRYKKGALAIAGLVVGSVAAGVLLTQVFAKLGFAGWLLEVFLVFTLLAQRSLYDHVYAVAEALKRDGLEAAREAVGQIVGRDPQTLDPSGVVRASIESLAENFSDGVVAPAIWYAVFGLPGLLAYKMINTADSMIAYRNERYEWFGRATAKVDDLANWLPARLSALLIAAGCGWMKGWEAAQRSLKCAFADSGLHRSPNAGWPEAAMAGGLGIALGGPRTYQGETVAQTHIHGAGRRHLHQTDIGAALRIFTLACFCGWGAIVALLILF